MIPLTLASLLVAVVSSRPSTEQYGRLPAGSLLFVKSSGMRPQGVIDNTECLSVRECLGFRISDFIKLGFALGLGWN